MKKFKKGDVVKSGKTVILVTGKGSTDAWYSTFSGVVISEVKGRYIPWRIGTYSETWQAASFKKVKLSKKAVINWNELVGLYELSDKQINYNLMKGRDIIRIYGVRELVPPGLALEPENLYSLKLENENGHNYLKIFDGPELIYLCKIKILA